jgi:hypothetical protein
MEHGGKARHAKEMHDMAWKGKTMHGLNRLGKGWHGSQGKVRHGMGCTRKA